MTTLEGFRLSPQQEIIHGLGVWTAFSFDICRGQVGADGRRGQVDAEQLKRCLVELLRRHEILRTRFEQPVGTREVLQVIDESLPPAYVGAVPEKQEPHSYVLLQFKETYVRVSFHLPAACLDNASLRVLANELLALYAGISLDDPIQYADLADWLHDLQDEMDDDSRAEIDARMAACQRTPLPFLSHQRRGEEAEFDVHEVPFALERNVAQDWLAAAWCGFLWRYLATEMLTVYTVFENRDYEGLEDTLGPLANALPIQVRPATELTVADLRMDWRSDAVLQQERCEYSLNAHARIAFSWQPLVEADREGLVLKQVGGGVRFPMRFDLHCVGRGSQVVLQANRACFSAGEVRSLAHHFEVFLQNLLRDETIALGNVPMVPPEAEQEPVPQATMWSSGIARVLQQDSHRAILQDANGVWSRAELIQQINRFAKALADAGIGKGDFVPVILARRNNAVAAMLAIHQQGAAWVFLEPNTPRRRLAFILEDLKATVVITDGEFDLDSESVMLLEPSQLPDAEEVVSYQSQAAPADIAYVTYTSGSTGHPKGVLISNRALSAYLAAVIHDLALPSEANYAHVSTLAADLGHTVLFPALMLGGVLHIIDNNTVRDGQRLAAYFKNAEIDVLKVVPGQLRALLNCENPADLIPQQRLIFGGERLDAALVTRVRQLRPKCSVFNHYGPSEATVGVLANPLEAHSESDPPLGQPLGNAIVEIRDPRGLCVPPGCVGELMLGGPTLAEGYLNLDEQTAASFRNTNSGLRYGSGDLAMQQVNEVGEAGEFVFIGRSDAQVKIRGFRIETGEVEQVLRQVDGVQEALVLVVGEGGQQRLRAWVVLASQVQPEDVRVMLVEFLPEPMIPDHIIKLAAFPRTSNGKVDHKRLPQPDVAQTAVDFADDDEATMANIWRAFFKTDVVHPESDFFHLGGSSLTATVLLHRIRRAFRVDLSIQEMFNAPTVRGLAQLVAKKTSAASEVQAITPAPSGALIPLSHAQRRLWVLYQLNPGSTAYNLPAALEVKGDFQFDAFCRALHSVIERHTILRSRIVINEAGEPIQEVVDNWDCKAEYVDLSDAVNADHQQAVLTETLRKQPFDFTKPILPRCLVIKRAAKRHLLLINMHHITTDAWSREVFISDLDHFYQAADAEIAALPLQYGDVAFHEQMLDHEAGLSWWATHLQGMPQLELPTDRARQPREYRRAGRVPLAFSEADQQALNSLSQALNVTPFMTLMLSYQILLAHYSGQQDFGVGFAVANRSQNELHKLIGFFVNTLVCRAKIGANEPMVEAASQVRQSVLQALEHSHTPFERLVDRMDARRDTTRSPLFQAMFLYRDTPGGDLRLGDLDLRLLELGNAHAKFDLTLEIEKQSDHLSGVLEYDADLFESSTVEQMGKHFRYLLTHLDSQKVVGEQVLLPQEQMLKTWRAWNPTTPLQPAPDSLIALFESTVDAFAEKVAVTFGDQRLTYAELDERANAVAWRLLEAGLEREDRVGLDTSRHLDTLVRLLAILKAGGAYVPMDASLPQARLEKMMAVTELRFCLGDLPNALEMLVETQGRRGRPQVRLQPEQLAYILFTSGSTGTPKGVAIPHQALVNFLQSMAHSPGLTSADKLVAVTPLTFDIAGLELLLPLLLGATVQLLDERTVRNGQMLAEALEHATVMQATPATWRMVLDAGWQPSSGLRMLCGGEALSQKLADELCDNGGEVVNLYGPTETTVWSSLAIINAHAKPHLGKPIDRTQFYLTDSRGNLVVDGAVGELRIGGAGLARGYFADPTKTALAFQPNPFATKPGERLYRTGDLCRLNTRGELLYLGRRDQQMKVRGFRIEADEVRTYLERISGIVAAAVIAKEDLLIAFVTATHDHEFDATMFTEWRNQLRKNLPEYMVPGVFHVLDELPLNANGKVDVRTLHAMDLKPLEVSRAPQTEAEKQMAKLWCEALGIDEVGMNDQFFQLGGHSLIAIRLASQIEMAFGKKLSLLRFFDQPTPAAALAQVEAGEDRAGIPAAKAPYVLSPAQQRLWVLDHIAEVGSSYAMGGGLRFRGDLCVETLAAALVQLVARHDMLRARIITTNETPYFVFTDQPFEMEHLQLEGEEAAQAWLYQPYDLALDALFRAALWSKSTHEHVLLLAAHHLIADDQSMMIFMRELMQIYETLLAGGTPQLAPLQVAYVDYAAWQASQDFEQGLAYWRERLAESHDVLLPYDHEPAATQPIGARHHFHLEPALVAWLEALPQTAFEVLLSAYQWLLARFSGSNRIQVGVSVAGRDRAELESIIGLFVNTVAMRADFSEGASFDAFLAENTEHIRSALAHSTTPFEQVIHAVQPDRHQPLFRAFFVLHSALETSSQLLQNDQLDVAWQAWDSSGARFDLSLSLQPAEVGYAGFLHYDATRFDAATMASMADAYVTLLRKLSVALSRPLDRLPFAAKPPLMKASKCTEHSSLLERFKTFARLSPASTCLQSGAESYTAAEVDRWSDDLAARLVDIGVEDVVAVLAARTPATVVAMLAIYKRGGVFLPIDPNLPRTRIETMLQDSNARYLIGDCDPGLSVDWVNVANSGLETPWQAVDVPSQATAYLIYTSGSTGQPKAVGVTHANIKHYLTSIATQVTPESGWHYALVSSLSADLGNTVLFLALGYQGVLHVLPQDHILDAQATAVYFQTHSIDVLKATPSHYRALLQTQESRALVPHRWLILGGEALESQVVDQVHALRPSCRVLNHYGPSETTVGVTRTELDYGDRVTIGSAFPSAQTFVVDGYLQLVPQGMPGELLIGGQQVSRGYVNRPDLTAIRFIPDPFGAFGGRLYRTGDLVRQRGCGDLLFLGRIDDQVKIRGHRVEPGEVAATLRQLPSVEDVAVLAHKGQLYGFVVGKDDFESLTQALRNNLPEHMVPQNWRRCVSLPRNANGKLDRHRLLSIAEEAGVQEETHKDEGLALSERESVMAELWQTLLKLDRAVQPHDNFFTLGGDSILAIRLVTLARQQGFELKPANVFEYPTLQELAHSQSHSRALATQAKTVGVVQMTPSQLDFFQRVHTNPSHYNQSLLLELPFKLDLDILTQALKRLIDHHDAMRFHFVKTDEGYQQVALEQVPAEIAAVCFEKPEEISVYASEVQRSLSLEKSPLWRIAVCHTDKRDMLLLVFHHLIVDTLSWWFVCEDLLAAYTALSEGREPRLPLKTTSFADWSAALADYAKTPDIQAEQAFWRSLGEGVAASPATQYPNKEARFVTQLTPDQEASLTSHNQRQEVLIAALAKVLVRQYGDVLLDVESHGRHGFRDDLDLTRTQGWFTAVFPVRLSSEISEPNAAAKQLAATPNQGLGYGLLRFLAGKADLPQAWIRFNYAGQATELSGSGLALSDVSRGAARAGSSGYVLDIQVEHQADGVVIDWRYDPATLAHEDVVSFGEGLCDALSVLLEAPTAPAADLVDDETLNDVLSAFDF